MKWLIDAQLPKRLAEKLTSLGHDALHTLELPAANSTTDAEINRIAVDENRVVVTKDSDFVDSFLVNGLPPQLLCLTTGNIRNSELLLLFETFLPDLERAFQQPGFVELSTTGLIVHP